MTFHHEVDHRFRIVYGLHRRTIELKRRIIFEFLQIGLVNASLVVVVIQTEMISCYINGRKIRGLPEIVQGLSEIAEHGSG